MLYPQTSRPPLAQEPEAQAHCMIVGNQITSHFVAQQMGRSHAPYPCGPHHGHPPQNQRIPLLCVTDHSSGHTEGWESLTPTQGATPKRGKTLPGTPSALTYSQGHHCLICNSQQGWEGGRSTATPGRGNPCPNGHGAHNRNTHLAGPP